MKKNDGLIIFIPNKGNPIFFFSYGKKLQAKWTFISNKGGKLKYENAVF